MLLAHYSGVISKNLSYIPSVIGVLTQPGLTDKTSSLPLYSSDKDLLKQSLKLLLPPYIAKPATGKQLDMLERLIIALFCFLFNNQLINPLVNKAYAPIFIDIRLFIQEQVYFSNDPLIRYPTLFTKMLISNPLTFSTIASITPGFQIAQKSISTIQISISFLIDFLISSAKASPFLTFLISMTRLKPLLANSRAIPLPIPSVQADIAAYDPFPYLCIKLQPGINYLLIKPKTFPKDLVTKPAAQNKASAPTSLLFLSTN
ncbi:hypothetical protein TTHERM_000024148 (macronuclear) [Tetrahymena thermophila SB210]|uniref:Uncharacterized protein n=1 Tax=Tetrahymena thermophila (strain SB210) TaxID=312017 RepID=W7XAI6_TETTS|nr:hypothetical protein TTHERM_000024148 [Tetrahymena thermophila SB210]EWS76395.1 hypothetical protein TTHERM_000024148 [Tetrahymena thermophila SB210]|eukprot:XP_012651179.1 hypothetical protein TTHERM_000024148 [Tetrahymena thermophila SB210]